MKKALVFTMFFVSNLAFSQDAGKIIKRLNTFWTLKFEEKGLVFVEPQIQVIESDYNFYYKNGVLTISKPFYKDLQKVGFSESLFTFIFAHEYSHAVADQLGTFEIVSAIREYQADCMAGVYFNNTYQSIDLGEIQIFLKVFNGESSKLSFRNILIDGHGTNDQRILAIYKGYNKGSVNTCISEYSLKLNN